MEADFQPCAKKSKLGDDGDVIVIEEIKKEDSNDINNEENCNTNKSQNEREEKHGLKLFINKACRVSGIIKQRYSDFMVRECDNDGNLVYLTDLNHCDHHQLGANKLATMDCPISDEILLGKIEQFSKEEDKSKTFTLDSDGDKEHRTLVHKYIKDTYKHIETDTALLDDGSRAITLSFKSNRANKRQQRKPWPQDLPKFCHFVLFKENRDTMECISVLAKMLHTNASVFGYAGTKDRRATTIQRISAKNIYSKQLANVNDKLINMNVGNFSYKEDGLRLGDLSGNNFTLVLRNVLDSDEQINLCCTSLKEKGFINYFGLQRFGTGSIPTHDIGKLLLKSKFEEAINLILHVTESDNQRRFELVAKKIWHRTKDAKKAYNAVKSRTSIEGRLLETLSRQTSYNYYNAFMTLPRNNRSMYLHSYQSLIWNNMVTKRIEDFGLEPCEGDLILNKEKDENGHATVSTLSKNDIDLKSYTIYNIVLPLPGYDVVYPDNKMAQYYKDAMSTDGIDIDTMKNKIKELSLSGSYRNVVVKPKEISWQIVKYDDYTISLINNDLHKLHSEKEDGQEKSVETVSSNQEGKLKAVNLQMALPQSCYATTALREVLVDDSSFQSQVALNENTKHKM